MRFSLVQFMFLNNLAHYAILFVLYILTKRKQEENKTFEICKFFLFNFMGEKMKHKNKSSIFSKE